MGEIQKQSIKGAIYTYGGAILGFIISGILFPKLLSTGQIGLISVLIAYALIFSQIASLGFIATTTRMFSYFRNYSNNHNGFLFIAVAVTIVGFLLAWLTFIITKESIISSNESDQVMLENYIYLLIPLIFSILFFNLFDHYNKVLFNAVRGLFYKEFLLRIFIIILIVFLVFNVFPFSVFMNLYVLCYFIPLALIVFALLKEKQLSLKPVRGFVDKDLSKRMISVSFFGIISTATGIITMTIDRIMVNDFAGMSATGIYTTCFFFGTIVILPSRSLLKTASTYIADAWKKNDIDFIKVMYTKSALMQAVVGVLMLVGIWANIDNIFFLLGDTFLPGKYVILFISLAFLTDLFSGVSSSIISNSKNYKVLSVLMIIMVITVIITNLILIPIYGLTGAAVATFLTKLIFNITKFLYVFFRFKMQPYNFRFILIIIIGLIAYIAGYFLPRMENFIFDIIVRSSVVFIIFISVCYLTNIATELNSIVDKLYRKVFN